MDTKKPIIIYFIGGLNTSLDWLNLSFYVTKKNIFPVFRL